MKRILKKINEIGEKSKLNEDLNDWWRSLSLKDKSKLKQLSEEK